MSHQHRHLESHSSDSSWKGIVAGAMGGLVAAWAMQRFMVVTQKLTGDRPSPFTEQGRSAADIRKRQRRGEHEGPPVKAASIVSERVFQHKLTPRQRRLAGPAVHYTMGVLMGAWYGVLAEMTPLTTKGLGMPYGAVIWLGADEIATPAAGLAPSPTREPLITHARAFAAHLVFGAATELSRRAILRALRHSKPAAPPLRERWTLSDAS